MLSEAQRREIDTLSGVYVRARSLAVDALKIVQRERGWVSDEDLAALAAHIGMSVTELDSLATSYNRVYRRAVGRHVILICDSVTCWIEGYESLARHLIARLGIAALGETSADGQFTLLPTACLGACDRAPAMMVDEKFFGNLTPSLVDEILGRYRADAAPGAGRRKE
jgi:NADH-quinone oxidoreductase subunit E